MKATSLPNLNRETTSFPNFFTLYQNVDHDDDDMTLNDRPNIDHGDDTEASETSPFNDILSLSLSPLVPSNEVGFSAAPRSVMMFRRESTLPTSSVGSNQFSGESGARSEGTSPAQLWRDRNNHPDFPEHELPRAFNMREEKSINPELWQACSGPLVNLPAAGTHVVYFPQGHSEQVAASLRKDVDAQIPNYPNLPSKLLCLLHNVTLHADPETDEVYAQMTLQPVPSFDKDALLRSDLSMKTSKPQTVFFCKTLTASDTSTHGGFSVPRRAAENIFPPLDFAMQPPAQELAARDQHDNLWTFRHIYRGQPNRHLLTTGWSLFVSGKRLFAGDSVLFIRDEKQQLLLGIRRANRQPTNLSSSVLSSDSMHIGSLAAAAHAAANNSPFTVFYNPRTSPSEFVIPLAKYYKADCSSQISLGMRFRMMFETEESGTRRYMGTVTGITDLDPARWKNSQWRNLQVGWDESTAGERRNRVSVWEIEPVTAPFFICPTPPFFGSKRPRQPGTLENLFKMNRNLSQWQQQNIGQNQQQNLMQSQLPDQMNQQPQMSGGQIQLQLLKLQQQQQAILEQQRPFLDPSQVLKLQQQQQAILEQQRPFLYPSQSFSRSVAPSQTLDTPQAISTSLPQAHLIPQQISRTNSQQNLRFCHPSQQPKQSDFPGHVGHTPTSNTLATAGSTAC